VILCEDFSTLFEKILSKPNIMSHPDYETRLHFPLPDLGRGDNPPAVRSLKGTL
jgi:hypothetical protein